MKIGTIADLIAFIAAAPSARSSAWSTPSSTAPAAGASACRSTATSSIGPSTRSWSREDQTLAGRPWCVCNVDMAADMLGHVEQRRDWRARRSSAAAARAQSPSSCAIPTLPGCRSAGGGGLEVTQGRDNACATMASATARSWYLGVRETTLLTRTQAAAALEGQGLKIVGTMLLPAEDQPAAGRQASPAHRRSAVLRRNFRRLAGWRDARHRRGGTNRMRSLPFRALDILAIIAFAEEGGSPPCRRALRRLWRWAA